MKNRSLLTLSVLAVGAPATSLAGGIYLYEIATPDVGLASAGYAARAQDASTVFKNPAGMSYLTEAQLQAGVQLLYGSVQFTPTAGTSPSLGNNGGGNAIGALPGLSAFFVQPLSERVAIGFGTFSNFGLASHYDDNWVGRYYVQKSTLVGVSLMPSVSFKATDWLSLGVGLNAMAGYLNSEVAVNNPGLAGDGQMRLKDYDLGFGANLGVILQPCHSTRIGITYNSAVNLGFNAVPSFSHLGPVMSALLANSGGIDLGMKAPQSIMLSGYHELDPQWAIMTDVGWQNWEQFGKVDVGVGPRGIVRTVNSNYQNTWHGAFGVQYRPVEQWQFTSGMAFDSSAVSSENRTVVLPMGRAWRLGVGATWQVSRAISLNAAYAFMWCGTMSVDQGQDGSSRGRVVGSYNDAWFSFVTANLTWRF